MRGFSLQAIRARVDRLAISVGAAGCGESHERLHLSDVWNDDPEPDWPPEDSQDTLRLWRRADISALCQRLHRVAALTTTVGTAGKRAACARVSESSAHTSILDIPHRGHSVRREQGQRHSIQLPGEHGSASVTGATRLA